MEEKEKKGGGDLGGGQLQRRLSNPPGGVEGDLIRAEVGVLEGLEDAVPNRLAELAKGEELGKDPVRVAPKPGRDLGLSILRARGK
jgi:hypothetical protein